MEVGFFEMLIIVVIAFVVLGPKDLIIRSRQVGRWIAKMKTELNNLKIMAEEQLLKDDLDVKKHIGIDFNEHIDPFAKKASVPATEVVEAPKSYFAVKEETPSSTQEELPFDAPAASLAADPKKDPKANG